MRQYIDTHGTGDADALITYAAALVTKYGEGSAELACQMYDALAEAANAGVPAAEPAEPADYGEVTPYSATIKDFCPSSMTLPLLTVTFWKVSFSSTMPVRTTNGTLVPFKDVLFV